MVTARKDFGILFGYALLSVSDVVYEMLSVQVSERLSDAQPDRAPHLLTHRGVKDPRRALSDSATLTKW